MTNKKTPDKSLSRRDFMKTTAVSSIAISAATSQAVHGYHTKNHEQTNHQEPFVKILEQYGSEFGDIRKAD